jgi:hypothetical protein
VLVGIRLTLGALLVLAALALTAQPAVAQTPVTLTDSSTVKLAGVPVAVMLLTAVAAALALRMLGRN